MKIRNKNRNIKFVFSRITESKTQKNTYMKKKLEKQGEKIQENRNFKPQKN
jgi:hypothetical protein